MAGQESEDHPPDGGAAPLRQPPGFLVGYVVLMTFAAGFLLYHLFQVTPDLGPGAEGMGAQASAAFLSAQAGGGAPAWTDVEIFLLTAGMMLCCGALGGCLYDIRGLIKHSAEDDFDACYRLSYYLRPFAGALSGLIVFFLLLGGALAFNLTPQNGNDVMGWKTFAGRMPYITFGLLAGYASHAFMMKLKEVADSVFSVRGVGAEPEGQAFAARRKRSR